MIALFKNNTRRLGKRLNQLVLIFMLTGLSLGVALYMSDQPASLGRFAVVGETSLPESGPYVFVPTTEKPTTAELMMGKYDGYLVDDQAGKLQIKTPKNAQLGEQVNSWLVANEEEREDVTVQKSVVSKIIGFVMLFLLLGGLTFLVLIGEDREQGQLQRVLLSPMSLPSYVLSQFLYSFTALYVPTMGLFSIIQLFFKQELGASLLTYSWLLALICLLGVSFATMMMSLLSSSDGANMLGSAFVILTTIIAGSFGSVGQQYGWFVDLSQVLPQKSLLLLVEQLETGNSASLIGYLVHIAFCSCLFLIVGVLGLKKQLER